MENQLSKILAENPGNRTSIAWDCGCGGLGVMALKYFLAGENMCSCCGESIENYKLFVDGRPWVELEIELGEISV
jgi:hypothetical protein